MFPENASKFWLVTGAVSAVILLLSAFLFVGNYRALESARLRELVDLQSRDYNEAIIFDSRQDMLRTERRYFVGGFAIGAVGLICTFVALRRRQRPAA